MGKKPKETAPSEEGFVKKLSGTAKDHALHLETLEPLAWGQRMTVAFDEDGDGRISYDEFVDFAEGADAPGNERGGTSSADIDDIAGKLRRLVRNS